MDDQDVVVDDGEDRRPVNEARAMKRTDKSSAEAQGPCSFRLGPER